MTGEKTINGIASESKIFYFGIVRINGRCLHKDMGGSLEASYRILPGTYSHTQLQKVRG